MSNVNRRGEIYRERIALGENGIVVIFPIPGAGRSDRVTKRVHLGYKEQSYSNATEVPTTWASVIDYIDFSKLYARGANLSDYKGKIARGEDATTTLSGTNFLIRKKGSVRFEWRGKKPIPGYPTGFGYYGACYDGNLTGLYNSATPILPPPQSVVDAAKMKFLSRCKAAQGAQSGTFLAEFNQVVRQIRRPLASMGKLLDSFQRKVKGVGPRTRLQRTRWEGMTRGQRAAALSSAVGGTWLEFKFGWIPTFADINSILNVYLDPEKFERASWPVRAHYESVDTTTTNSLQSLGGTGCLVRYCTKVETEFQVIFRGGIRGASAGAFNNPLEKYGITLQEFIPTIWNIIPYSFLVDYVANVGDIIEAATFDRSSLSWVNWTTRAVKRTTVTLTSMTPPNVPSGYIMDTPLFNFEPIQYETFSFVRLPYINSFVPAFRWNIDNLGLGKILNLTALLAQSRVTQAGLQRLL